MSQDQQDVFDSWIKFLDPESLKSNLISASVFLVGWETFEQSIVSHLEGFYCVGFEGDQLRFENDYSEDVLSRHRSIFRASMLWFKDRGAIDDDDLDLADRARQHRNDIAHNLPMYIASAAHAVDCKLFGELCRLGKKIDVWWIRNVEAAINDNLDEVDIDSVPDTEIIPGNSWFLGLLVAIAKCDDERFCEAFRNSV